MDKPIHVLLIEDNPGDARLIHELLKEGNHGGIELITADRLSKGLRLLNKKNMDVVLLDLALPDSSGIDTFDKTNAQAPGLPIIILTGLDDETRALEAVRKGAQDYLIKGDVTGLLLNKAVRYAIQRKQTEVELRLRSEIMTNLSEGIVLIKASDGTIIYTNPTFAEMFGYEVRELIGKHISIINAPTDITPQEIAQNIINVLNQEGVWNGETYNIRKDGSIFYCHSSISTYEHPIYGKVWIAIRRDITDRKRAEEQVRQAALYTRSLLEASIDPLVTINADGKILDVNKATEEVTGVSREHLIGSDFLDYFSEPEKARAGYQQVFKQGYVRDYPLTIQHTSGRRTEVLYNATTYADESGKVQGVFAAARDITERKQAEEKIMAYQKRLQSLASELVITEERERRDIATVIHDEISQSLAVCRMKLHQFMERDLVHQEIKELKEIQKLIEESLQFTRTLTFDLSPPVLYELGLESAIDWLCEEFQKKHKLEVKFTSDRQPKPMSRDIQVMLFKAVRELLMNIVKHARAKNAWISLSNEDSGIKIVVKDNGVGMVRNKMDFTHTKGFGLFNVRERLTYLGGSFKIESVLGQGTTISVSAPLKANSNKGGDYEN